MEQQSSLCIVLLLHLKYSIWSADIKSLTPICNKKKNKMTAHNQHQQQQHRHTEAQNHSYCVAERKLRDRHPAPPTGTSWSNDCCGLCRGLTVNLWGRSWFIPVRRNLTIRVQSSAFHSLDSSTFFFLLQSKHFITPFFTFTSVTYELFSPVWYSCFYPAALGVLALE